MQTLERTPSRAPYHALAARMEVIRLALERAEEARLRVAPLPTTGNPGAIHGGHRFESDQLIRVASGGR